MLNRTELKAKAKAAFKANYWKCVLVGILLSLFTASGASVTSSTTTNAANQQQGTNEAANQIQQMAQQNPEAFKAFVAVLFGGLAVIAVIGVVIDIFLNNPLTMGCRSFFLKNTEEPAELDNVMKGFKPSYMRNVKTLFLKDLLISLWGLLFIVPGIIKGLAYSQTQYILAEDPEISGMDALKKSEQMMMGHKWEKFVLGLSFFGWIFAGILTLGLGMIFYVSPYMEATEAQYYQWLKEQA